jgi:hypothetical protein
MITRKDIEDLGGSFMVEWTRDSKAGKPGTVARYSGKMSPLPAKGKDTDNRFLLDTVVNDKAAIRTVIIPNIIFVAGGPILENMPLDTEDVA